MRRISVLFLRHDPLIKSRGWWSPLHGGTHARRMSTQDYGGSGDHPYRDGAVLPASALPHFYQSQVKGKAKGAVVPNPVFVLGELGHQQSSLVAKYLGLSDAPRQVRMTGRTLKHADERRPDVVQDIIAELPVHFVDQARVLPNPKDPNRVLLISSHRTTLKGKRYVAAVELERYHDALYLATMMTMPERTFRQALQLVANWQEGQRPPQR